MQVLDVLNVVNNIRIEIRSSDGMLLRGGYAMDDIVYCDEINRKVILIKPYKDLLLIYVD